MGLFYKWNYFYLNKIQYLFVKIGTVFSVPHQLASLFILEEEIIGLIEKSNIENSVFVDYLQLWKARYNELKTNDELKVRYKIVLIIF